MFVSPRFTFELLTDRTFEPVFYNFVRVFASAIVFVSLLTWRCRSVTDRAVRRIVTSSLFVYCSLATGILLWGQLSGMWGAFGWTSIGTYAIVAVAYGYFSFLRPE